jgi:predicted nuclease of predicted toxin-antitoxin system
MTKDVTKNDGLIVEYDEDTRQMKLEWDENDPKWNWLNNMSQQEIQEVITGNLQRMLAEHEQDGIGLTS